jgi:hypothetical protein
MDVLDDLPPSSRRELIEAVQSAFGVTPEAAEAILRASEAFGTPSKMPEAWLTRGVAASSVTYFRRYARSSGRRPPPLPYIRFCRRQRA